VVILTSERNCAVGNCSANFRAAYLHLRVLRSDLVNQLYHLFLYFSFSFLSFHLFEVSTYFFLLFTGFSIDKTVFRLFY